MLDAAYELNRYLPIKTSLADVDQYLAHHTGSLVQCVEQGLFSSAYSHLHLLYMTYVYVQLLRIATEDNTNFQYCWIGFPNEEKDFLKRPTSPFAFSPVKEASVFRFFRLIGFDDTTIGHIARPIKERNKRLHASGNIFCDTQAEFEREIKEYTSRIDRIESLQFSFLESIYDRQIGLYQPDEEGNEFEMTNDEIETNFVEQYMLSEHQLTRLAEGKQDTASLYICDNYA